MYRYTEIIKTIRTIAPQAHIAGGAVRDTILEKPIHDIDVFMDDDHVEEAAKLLRSRLGFVKVGEWQQYLGFSDPAMERVAKFERAEETIPLCIIGLKSKYAEPEANIARFDFGICMAAFDGENVLRAPPVRQRRREQGVHSASCRQLRTVRLFAVAPPQNHGRALSGVGPVDCGRLHGSGERIRVPTSLVHGQLISLRQGRALQRHAAERAGARMSPYLYGDDLIEAARVVSDQ
jgi:hypothetical protein